MSVRFRKEIGESYLTNRLRASVQCPQIRYSSNEVGLQHTIVLHIFWRDVFRWRHEIRQWHEVVWWTVKLCSRRLEVHSHNLSLSAGSSQAMISDLDLANKSLGRQACTTPYNQLPHSLTLIAYCKLKVSPKRVRRTDIVFLLSPTNGEIKSIVPDYYPHCTDKLRDKSNVPG